MSAGSPRGGKANIQLIFIFHHTSIHNTCQKKYQAWWFSEGRDFSANFSIWMYTWWTTEYWTLYQTNNTSKKNQGNTSSLIFLNLQCPATTATSKAFSSFTLVFKEITGGVNQSVLIQHAFINILFFIHLQYPAFVATLTCHPPGSLMLLTNFILFPNPQMLFLSQSRWPLGYCALCTAGSGPWSIQPRTVWQKQQKTLPRDSKATAMETWFPLLCYQTPPRKICHWTDVFPSKGEF